MHWRFGLQGNALKKGGSDKIMKAGSDLINGLIHWRIRCMMSEFDGIVWKGEEIKRENVVAKSCPRGPVLEDLLSLALSSQLSAYHEIFFFVWLYVVHYDVEVLP